MNEDIENVEYREVSEEQQDIDSMDNFFENSPRLKQLGIMAYEQAMLHNAGMKYFCEAVTCYIIKDIQMCLIKAGVDVDVDMFSHHFGLPPLVQLEDELELELAPDPISEITEEEWKQQ